MCPFSGLRGEPRSLALSLLTGPESCWSSLPRWERLAVPERSVAWHLLTWIFVSFSFLLKQLLVCISITVLVSYPSNILQGSSLLTRHRVLKVERKEGWTWGRGREKGEKKERREEDRESRNDEKGENTGSFEGDGMEKGQGGKACVHQARNCQGPATSVGTQDEQRLPHSSQRQWLTWWLWEPKTTPAPYDGRDRQAAGSECPQLGGDFSWGAPGPAWPSSGFWPWPCSYL